MDDLLGQTIGQYRIEARLGTGGMGQVFRGVHQLLDRPAAIKVMQAHLAIDPEFRARFLREARAAAALKHPHIVEVYDFGEQNGTLYLVMELMLEGSLRTFLRRMGGQPLPIMTGLDLIRQAASGLAAANLLHMVHRDIKPDNLLLTYLSDFQTGERQTVLKISDFGLARLVQGSEHTSMGGPMGTLAYMSPEQCQGMQLDGRSDLYSLGVVLYEVLTGSPPFQISNFHEAMYKHCMVQPPSPRQARPDVSPAVEEIVLRCLAKQPQDRYATARELATALQGVINSVDSTTFIIARPSQGRMASEDETLIKPSGSVDMLPITGSTSSTFIPVPGTTVLKQHTQTPRTLETTRIAGQQNVATGGDTLVTPPGRIVKRRVMPKLLVAVMLVLLSLGVALASLFGPKLGPTSPRQVATSTAAVLVSPSAGPAKTASTRASPGTAQGNATATALATGTAIAQGNATATAQALSATATAQGNATATATASQQLGSTWTAQARITTNTLNSVTWGDSKYVAVGVAGTILTSPDGRSWTIQNSGTSSTLQSVTWTGSQFIAVGGMITDPGTILTSPDGIKWTVHNLGTGLSFVSVISSQTLIVVVGSGGAIYTSSDGSHWTSQTSQAATITSIIWTGSQFLMVGDGFYSSPDGVTWTTLPATGATSIFGDIAWSGSTYIGVGSTVFTSPDSFTWTAQHTGTSTQLIGVIWTGTRFIVVGTSGTILTSPNGTTWTMQNSGTTYRLEGVASSGSQYVAVGDYGTILTSP